MINCLFSGSADRCQLYNALLNKMLLAFILIVTSTLSYADAESNNTMKKLSANIQALKRDVIDLNKDLRILEESILFPSSTKYTVFLSLSTGKFFKLESAKLKLDGELAVSHLYSDRQRQSLARGGVQKLFMTNLSEGTHEITAFITGVGPNGRPYKLAETLRFQKLDSSGNLELVIRDNSKHQEPEFTLKQW